MLSKSATAILYNLFCTLCFSSGGMFIRLSRLTAGETSLNFGIVGTFFAMTLSCLFEDCESWNWRTRVISFVNGSIFSGGFNFFYLCSLNYIALGDAISLTVIGAYIISLVLELIRLRLIPEKLTLLAACIGLSGMIVMCRPSALFNSKDVSFDYLIGTSFCVLSASFGAVFYVNLQHMKSVHASFHTIGYCFGLIIYALPFIYKSQPGGLSVCSPTLRMMSTVGVALSAVAGYLAVQGSQLSNPSASYLIKLFSIICSYFLQSIFLPDPVEVMSIAGSVLIVTGIALQSFVMTRDRGQL